jgi:hypothetical protein
MYIGNLICLDERILRTPLRGTVLEMNKNIYIYMYVYIRI